MIENSYWRETFSNSIVPEQFLEITIGVLDAKAINSATVVPTKEGSTSDISKVLGVNESTTPTGYATTEKNLWTLDGTKKIRQDDGAKECGYVGYVAMLDVSQIRIELPEPTTKAIPGFVIVWSSEYQEYPTSFTVRLERDGILIAENRIDNNHSYISIVDTLGLSELSNYDTVKIWVNEWNTPYHNVRIERVILGHSWVFGKNDILSFSHEQTGDLLCAELPKNSIEFSLDNTDGKWDPFNPTGIGKYLSERQEVIVKYGLREHQKYGENINWINAGKFYLSEWDTPANGLEARFVARDPFEFMLTEMYDDRGLSVGTFEELIRAGFDLCEFSNDLEVNITSKYGSVLTFAPNDHLELVKDSDGNVKFTNPKYSVAEIIQMCMGAICSVCWFDRNGVLQMADSPWETNADLVYEIPLDIAYSYPEIKLNKPVKYLEYRYMPIDDSEGYYKLNTELCDNGVTQTINNPIGISRNLMYVSYFYMKSIATKRAVVSGEFRANPCLDVFDNVKVTTKYGDMNLIVTRIKYTYNGSFHGEYTAQGYEEFSATEASE